MVRFFAGHLTAAHFVRCRRRSRVIAGSTSTGRCRAIQGKARMRLLKNPRAPRPRHGVKISSFSVVECLVYPLILTLQRTGHAHTLKTHAPHSPTQENPTKTHTTHRAIIVPTYNGSNYYCCIGMLVPMYLYACPAAWNAPSGIAEYPECIWGYIAGRALGYH